MGHYGSRIGLAGYAKAEIIHCSFYFVSLLSHTTLLGSVDPPQCSILSKQFLLNRWWLPTFKKEDLCVETALHSASNIQTIYKINLSVFIYSINYHQINNRQHPYFDRFYIRFYQNTRLLNEGLMFTSVLYQ